MEIEKGKTVKYLKDKRQVSQAAKDNLKEYLRVKKAIMDALKDNDLTINDLTKKLQMPRHEVVYYLLSLVKYGFVQTGEIDDMDEYFLYKLKK